MRLQPQYLVFPLIVFFFSLCVSVSGTNAQSYWCDIDYFSEPDGMADVAYVNYSTFVAVGQGDIIRSTDGGLTWTSVATPGGDLKSVSFADSLLGVTVGDEGLILRTTDGGINWQTYSGVVTGDLVAIFLNDPLKGTIIASQGAIHQTTDGGTTWSLHANSVSIPLSAIPNIQRCV